MAANRSCRNRIGPSAGKSPWIRASRPLNPRPSEDVGRGARPELDGCGQAQEIISVAVNRLFINGFVGADHPIVLRPAHRLEDMAGQPVDAFYAGREREAE